MVPSGRFWEKSYPPEISADFVPSHISLGDMFVQLVTEHGPGIAIDYFDHEISYTELGRQAARVANALRRDGIGSGDTVALYLPNTPFHPFFFFGALLTGARVTHLSPLDAKRELDYKIRNSGAKTLVTLASSPFSDMSDRLCDTGDITKAILCDDAVYGGMRGNEAEHEKAVSFSDFIENTSDELTATKVDPNEIALLQYTGGTTGHPKAAILTNANLVASSEMYAYWATSFENDGKNAIVLTIAPMFHIMGLVAGLFRRIKLGSKMVLRQRFDLEQAINDIEQKRITGFGGVPTIWIAMLNYPGIEEKDLSSLANIGYGGAPMPPEVFLDVKKLTGLSLGGGWGMTETGSAGTSQPPEFPLSKAHSVGLPLPGLEIEIVSVDDPTRKLPFGETGEMRVKGPNITTGYWNNPEETERSFVDGWLLTGDIGWMDEDGYLYLVDRKKDLILSGGYNVYPQVIENAILEHPGVAEVLVIGVPDVYRGESAKAYIILKKDAAEFDITELRDFLSDKLGKHELPKHLEFRTDLPKTAVGKYSRKLLRDQELK